MVHGRFQPFHNGHLAYVRAAAARAGRLLVGITSPDRARTRVEAEDPVRHLPEANPFTYTERLLMVGAALRGDGLGAVPIVPFPISDPELWPDYVPPGTVHFLRVRSPWGEAKVARLRTHGHAVVVLEDETASEVSGAHVRAAMRAGGDWEALVPPGVADLVRRLPGARAPAPRRTA